MTNALRLGRAIALSWAVSCVAGCGMAQTLDDDSGITLPDGGGGGHDSGTVLPGTDSGTILPGTDGGMPPPPVDGGRPPRPDGGFVIPDSGPGYDAGTTMGIMCGGTVCAASEVCCVTRGAGGMMLSEMCTAAGACMGFPASCDGPEDCMSGQVCCAMGGAGGGGSAMCVDSAMCGGFTSARLCHADGDCDTGDSCCMFMGINACLPRCF